MDIDKKYYSSFDELYKIIEEYRKLGGTIVSPNGELLAGVPANTYPELGAQEMVIILEQKENASDKDIINNICKVLLINGEDVIFTIVRPKH